jgi:methyltransferase-like protein/2-polyprenyl-3-methyl-5-hydroxy-6-metoxy-1,4-benzoquinol methylase
MSTEITQTRYDTVPYPIKSFPQTHPAKTSVTARLFGMTPAPVEKCRVLELGCAHGGNLVPMAQALPESQFVGIDLSQRQIDAGKKMIEGAGLKNVELRQANILDLNPAELGTFDYVIAHGLFTWVKKEVQDKILKIAHDCLNPQGVAYISYNTLPGWRMRGMLREMMMFHTSQFPDEATKAKQGYALINFLHENVDAKDNPYGLLLQRELESIKNYDVSYFIHEFLAETNEPCYFYEFIGRAMGQGLQYLGEASFASMLVNNLPEKAATTLQGLSKNIIATEQYMDFLRNRPFRQTLLCRRDVKLNRNVSPAVLKELALICPLKPVSAAPSLDAGVKEAFQGVNNATINSEHPYVKAFLLELVKAQPHPVPFAQAHEKACAAIQGKAAAPSEQEINTLLGLLMNAFSRGLLDVAGWTAPVATQVSAKPCVTPLARFQAGVGLSVTSQRHSSAGVDAFSRKLMILLDGSRDLAALVNEMVAACVRKELSVANDGKPVEDEAQLRKIVGALVPRTLAQLAAAGYLVA